MFMLCCIFSRVGNILSVFVFFIYKMFILFVFVSKVNFVLSAGEYKDSQEWFITRDVQDVRVVRVCVYMCIYLVVCFHPHTHFHPHTRMVRSLTNNLLS